MENSDAERAKAIEEEFLKGGWKKVIKGKTVIFVGPAHSSEKLQKVSLVARLRGIFGQSFLRSNEKPLKKEKGGMVYEKNTQQKTPDQ